MSFSKLNHTTASEKQFIPVESGIDLDPPTDHNDTTSCTKQVADGNDARGNYSVSPNGISNPQPASDESARYIAKLEWRLKMALEHNQILRKQNQEVVMKFASHKRTLKAEKAKRMEIEETLKKEKEERVRLEQELITVKEEREKEIVFRKEIQLKLTGSEEKCLDTQKVMERKEETFRMEITNARKEIVEKERENRKSETELKDMFRENGLLKDRLDHSQRELESVNEKINIMQKIDKARELHVQQYQKERNEDLMKLSDLLYDMKKKTATCIDRFRREPSGKHRRLNDCIIAVNKRISCCP